MGQRKKYWQAMGSNAEQRIPGSRIYGNRPASSIVTEPMTDRKRELVKKWITSTGERRRSW